MGTDAAQITGGTAAEIAESIRGLVERGRLAPGAALPPVRALAEQLGINRNTAVAAYRDLARSGVVVSQGRAGTRVARRTRVPQEGYAPSGALRDVGNGNPDPRWREVAVTFVDNHDTGYSPGQNGGQHHWALQDGLIRQAYAYILTSPGTPVVWWLRSTGISPTRSATARAACPKSSVPSIVS